MRSTWTQAKALHYPTNWKRHFHGTQLRTLFSSVLTMLCQAVRMTFTSCSCLDLTASPCMSCRSHVWSHKVFQQITSTQCPTKQRTSDMSQSVCGSSLIHLWGHCCHGMKQSGILVAGHYSSKITIQSNPTRVTKEIFAWLTDFDHQQATDLARLPATQCSSWLYFAAEALVLLCVRKNNMERCCRLKWLWLPAIVEDAILLTLAHSPQITRLGLRRWSPNYNEIRLTIDMLKFISAEKCVKEPLWRTSVRPFSLLRHAGVWAEICELACMFVC